MKDTKEKATKLQAHAKNAFKNASIATNILKKKRALINSDQISAQAARAGRPVRQSDAVEQEKASIRVKDVTSALRKTAGKRREQSVQKQSNSFSSAWVQSFPGLPNSLKKSLWHKMHRRRQQIILRPTEECLVNGLRERVTEVLAGSRKRIVVENELLKAEQLYLLATHPVGEIDLPTVPPSKSSDSWAEPGWKVILEVPENDRKGRYPALCPLFPRA